jgi:hypothetical protein
MRVTCILLATIVIWGCGYQLNAQTSGCRPADAVSSRTLQTLLEIVTSTDSADVAYRDSLGLEPTTASKVALVTDNRTCQTAVGAFNSLVSSPGAVRSVFTYKVGSFFAVEDPGHPRGEYRAVAIFDRRWAYKNLMLTF